MNRTLLTIAGMNITASEASVGFAAIVLTVLVAIAGSVMRASRQRSLEAARDAVRAEEIESRIADLARIQADTAGRVHMMGEALAGRQAELARVVADRLDAVTHRDGRAV